MAVPSMLQPYMQTTPPPGTYTQSVRQTGTTGGTPVPEGTSTQGAGALQQYDNAWQQAHNARRQVGDQLVEAQKALAAYQPENAQTASILGDPQQKALQDQVTHLQSAYDTLLSQEASAAGNRADAYAKAAQQADPVNRATLQAVADKARTDADVAAGQFKEWQGTADDRKAQVAAQQRLAGLQADTAQLNLDVARANAPGDLAAAQQRLDANGVAIQQAQSDLDVSRQTAGNRVALSGQAVQQGQQNLSQGQLSLQDLARQVRQAPNDEQARQALEQALAQGGANLAATQQQTARSAALQPGELVQQGANLASTQASTEATQQQTQAGKQGTLYGLDDYIKQQKDAIARGLLTADQADQALSARIAGTDAFSAAKAAEAAQMGRADQGIAQRGQDASLAASRFSTYGGMMNTGLGQFMNLNNTVQPGSDAAGRGFLAYADMMQQRAGAPQFSAPPQVQSPGLPPMLQQFASQQPGTAQTAQTRGIENGIPLGGGGAPGPDTSAVGAHTVVINIGGGGGGQSTPQLQGNASGVGGNGTGVSQTPFQAQPPPQAQMPAFLDKMRPATPEDVQRIYGRGQPGVM